jgi:hypothetical protein
MLTVPDCVLSFKNILLIVMFITLAYVLLDVILPNTVVIKLRKVDKDVLRNMNKNELETVDSDTRYP